MSASGIDLDINRYRREYPWAFDADGVFHIDWMDAPESRRIDFQQRRRDRDIDHGD